MVQFKTAALGLVIALCANLGEAFSPSSARPTNPANPAARKVELARTKVENMFGSEYTNMVDSMKMVSGGAQAEEYYEGESSHDWPLFLRNDGKQNMHMFHSCQEKDTYIYIYTSYVYIYTYLI